MGRHQVARVFVLALFALTLYLLYLVFLPFLSGIAWAVFLATAFHPFYRWLVRRMRGRDLAAAVLATAVVAAIIIAPAVLLVSSLAQTVTVVLSDAEDHLRAGGKLPSIAELTDTTRLGGKAAQEEAAAGREGSRQEDASRDDAAEGRDGTIRREGASGNDAAARPEQKGPNHEAGRSDEGDRNEGSNRDEGSDRAAAQEAGKGSRLLRSRLPLVRDLEAFLGRYMDVSRVDLDRFVVGAVKQFGQVIAEGSSSLLQNLLWTLVMFAITVFTMVYFFREGPSILRSFQEFLPLPRADKEAVFERLHEVTRAVFYGVIMTSVIQAILGALGWALVGLPSPMTAGIGMFFCSLIPVGGTFLVWGPGAVYLLVKGFTVKGIALAIWGLAIVSMVDNFLRPLFISGRTRMHALLVFFGVLGGMTAFGVAGLFLGPMLITLFLFLIEVIRRDLFQKEDPLPPPGSSPPLASPPA